MEEGGPSIFVFHRPCHVPAPQRHLRRALRRSPIQAHGLYTQHLPPPTPHPNARGPLSHAQKDRTPGLIYAHPQPYTPSPGEGCAPGGRPLLRVMALT